MGWLARKIKAYYDWLQDNAGDMGNRINMAGILFILPFFIIMFVITIPVIWLT